ncbi:MAG: TPM domain-containing protein, partial [Terracidiphilus sp.]
MRTLRRVPFAVFRLLVAVCVAVFAFAAQAERVEDLPQPTDYVSDYAHVLSPEAIAQLDKICAQLDHSKANAQIAVVTIHTLGG